VGEAEVIAGQQFPRTRESLAADLRALGLPAGATVLVHTSLSAMGWVAGGPVAVVHALLDVLGPDGTLVVPTQSPGLSEPSSWSNPPVPAAWWPVIRDATPAYDPELTPPGGMGAVVEVVRHLPGFRRSDHPLLSFGAVGPAAASVLDPHPLAPALGDGSPLDRLAESGARTLLLGVGWDSATCLHLGEAAPESRHPSSPEHRSPSPANVAGPPGRTWTGTPTSSLPSAPTSRPAALSGQPGSARLPPAWSASPQPPTSPNSGSAAEQCLAPLGG